MSYPFEPASAALEDPSPARLPLLLLRARDLAVRHRAVVGTVGASFVLFALQAAQGMLLARVLGPEGRGQYNTASFYSQLLLFAGLLGIPFAIQRRAAMEKGRLAALTTSSAWAGLATGLIAFAAVALLALVGLPGEKFYLAPLCIACGLSLPLHHMRLALQAVDRGSGAFLRFNASELFGGAALPVLLIAVWIAGGASVETVVWLMLIASAAALVLRLLLERPRFAWRGGQPPARTLLKEGMPFALAKGATDLLNRFDSLLILWLAGFTVQGYYAAAVPAANMLAVAPAALAIFAFNAGAKGARRMSLGRLLSFSGMIAGIQTISALAFALVLPTLMIVVFGADFAGAIPFALALLPAKVAGGCSMIAGGYLQGCNKSHVELRARIAGAVAMVVGVTAAWPFWREFSVPFGAMLGQTLACAIVWLAVLWDARSSRSDTAASD